MESRTFTDPLVWDSNYTACLAASDGQVYVGLNYHGKGATVAVYDPGTDTMKTLGDMNVIAGQPNVWVEPNRKCILRSSKEPMGASISGLICPPSSTSRN